MDTGQMIGIENKLNEAEQIQCFLQKGGKCDLMTKPGKS